MIQRRAQPWYKEADRAYPIRLKFVVPQGGMREYGASMAAQNWLHDNLGPHMWNWGPVDSSACTQATAYYFRRMEDAQRFLAAFPELLIADGVKAPIDPEPKPRVQHQGWSHLGSDSKG